MVLDEVVDLVADLEVEQARTQGLEDELGLGGVELWGAVAEVEAVDAAPAGWP